MPNGMVLMCGKMILSIDNVLKNYKMKMKLFLRISVLALCISMSLSSFADDKKDRISPEQIDWSANNESLETIVSTSADPNKIYLYAKGHNKFVTVGGRYGAQPILAEVGMYFYVEEVANDAKDGNKRYYIHSWVHNPTTAHESGLGDYLGVEPTMNKNEQYIFSGDNKSIYLFVDRGKDNYNDEHTISSPERVQWYIEPVVGTINGYQIYSTWKDDQDANARNYYLAYYADPNSQKKFLVVTTDKSQAETFYFIKREDYRNVINSQNKKYINVSGLVRDARFERNNKGIDGNLLGDYNPESKNVWQFRYDRSDHAFVFPNLQNNVEELAYMTAWVGSEGSKEKKGNYLIQKIKNLKPGLYRVNCQGFYFNPKNQYDKDNTSFVFASQDYTDISNQTALKTIEPADWDLMQNMTYNGLVTDDDLKGYDDYSIKHCVNAGKIFAERNPYEDKDVDHRKYDNSVAVLVKADKNSPTGTGTLYIGAGKSANGEGYAFFDNFQLFYMGDKQWYLDATNTSTDDFTTTKSTDDYDTPSGINRNPAGPDQYKFPVTYNIRRYFYVGKWESLILPCTLTGDQVKQTFGGDQGVQLSVFDRVDGTCVYFKTVDLDTDSIVAGTPYIIKVGKEADIKKGDEYTFPWGNNTTLKVKGPIYQVKGVVPPTFTGDGVIIDKTSGGYTVQFHGFYYDKGAAPRNAYVVNNGNMYHLSSDWNSFVGTSWYVTITDADGNAKALSFSFDGDSSTTAIENVTRQEDAAVQTDGFVYNLSGQRVGTRNNMSNLSSGIYIVAGKKVVVK